MEHIVNIKIDMDTGDGILVAVLKRYLEMSNGIPEEYLSAMLKVLEWTTSNEDYKTTLESFIKHKDNCF